MLERVRTLLLRFGPRASELGFDDYQQAMAELEAARRCGSGNGDGDRGGDRDGDRGDEDEEAFETARMNAAIAAVLYHARLVLELSDHVDVARLSALALGTPNPVQLRFLGVPELASLSAAIHEALNGLRTDCLARKLSTDAIMSARLRS
jgi:hypothetical protein